jgi:uncharacterized protein (DUF486 family)
VNSVFFSFSIYPHLSNVHILPLFVSLLAGYIICLTLWGLTLIHACRIIHAGKTGGKQLGARKILQEGLYMLM